MVEIIGKITGADVVASVLRKMPESTRKKAVRPALRAGANLIKKQVIENIKSDLTEISTHTFEKSISIRAAKAKRFGDVRVAVAIQAKKLNPKNNQRVGLYGSVREFGKEGQPPKPVFRTSIKDKANDAVSAVTGKMHINFEATIQDAKK